MLLTEAKSPRHLVSNASRRTLQDERRSRCLKVVDEVRALCGLETKALRNVKVVVKVDGDPGRTVETGEKKKKKKSMHEDPLTSDVPEWRVRAGVSNKVKEKIRVRENIRLHQVRHVRTRSFEVLSEFVAELMQETDG